MRQLNEEWTADIVGKLHRLNATQIELAKKCGYTASYLSLVLNGKKKFESSYAAKVTRKHICRAMEELENEILDGR